MNPVIGQYLQDYLEVCKVFASAEAGELFSKLAAKRKNHRTYSPSKTGVTAPKSFRLWRSRHGIDGFIRSVGLWTVLTERRESVEGPMVSPIEEVVSQVIGAKIQQSQRDKKLIRLDRTQTSRPPEGTEEAHVNVGDPYRRTFLAWESKRTPLQLWVSFVVPDLLYDPQNLEMGFAMIARPQPSLPRVNMERIKTAWEHFCGHSDWEDYERKRARQDNQYHMFWTTEGSIDFHWSAIAKGDDADKVIPKLKQVLDHFWDLDEMLTKPRGRSRGRRAQ
jgi:hypothetical protein